MKIWVWITGTGRIPFAKRDAPKWRGIFDSHSLTDPPAERFGNIFVQDRKGCRTGLSAEGTSAVKAELRQPLPAA